MRVRALAYGVALQALFSGPQPGEPLPSFKVLVCNGPRAGREADLVSEFGDAPVLILFAHYLDRNVQGSPSAFARAELSRLKEEMQK